MFTYESESESEIVYSANVQGTHCVTTHKNCAPLEKHARASAPI